MMAQQLARVVWWQDYEHQKETDRGNLHDPLMRYVR